MAEEKIIFQVDIDASEAQKEAEKLTLSIEEQRAELARLKKAYKDGQISSEQYARETVKLKNSISEQSKELRIQNKALTASANSVGALRAEASKLQRQLDKTDFQSPKYKELEDRLSEVRKRINGADEAVENFRGNVGNYQSAFTGAFDKIGVSLNAVFGPAAIAATIGAGIAAFASYQQQVEKTRLQVAALTKTQGAELNRLTAQIQSLAQVYDEDVNEVLLATNALSQQLGISQTEAAEKIAQGFAVGANASGEFLESIKEFGPQFAQAGLSADAFVQVIAKGVETGTFTNTAADAVAEFNKRATGDLKKFEKAVLELEKQTGDTFAKNLVAGVKAGTTTTGQALQTVSAQIAKLPPQSVAAQKALTEMFGGPGETAGVKFIASLSTINTSLDEATQKAEGFASIQERQRAAQEEINLVFAELAGASGSFFTQARVTATEFAAKGLRFIVDSVLAIVNYFIDLYNESTVLRIAFNSVGFVAKQAFSGIITAAKLAINIFKSFGRILKGVFTLDLDEIKGGFQQAFSESAEIVSDFGKQAGKDFNEALKNITSKEKVKAVTLSPPEVAQAKAEYKKVGKATAKAFVEEQTKEEKKAREKAQKEALEAEEKAAEIRVRNAKAAAERAVIATEEGTARRLAAEIALLQAERDAKLLSDQLTNEERLLIEDQYFAAKAEKEAAFREFQKAEANKSIQEQEAETQRLAELQAQAVEGAISFASNSVAQIVSVVDEGSETYKGFAILQAKIDTINATIAAYKSTAAIPIIGPTLAPAAAVAAATFGAVKIAQITGFADGGFTGAGLFPDWTGHKVAGIVHDGEYVIPKRMVNSAKFAPVISGLETARTRGFADGGFTSRSASASVESALSQTSDIVRIVESIPPPVVRVSDINKVNNRNMRRESKVSQ